MDTRDTTYSYGSLTNISCDHSCRFTPFISVSRTLANRQPMEMIRFSHHILEEPTPKPPIRYLNASSTTTSFTRTTHSYNRSGVKRMSYRHEMRYFIAKNDDPVHKQ